MHVCPGPLGCQIGKQMQVIELLSCCGDRVTRSVRFARFDGDRATRSLQTRLSSLVPTTMVQYSAVGWALNVYCLQQEVFLDFH